MADIFEYYGFHKIVCLGDFKQAIDDEYFAFYTVCLFFNPDRFGIENRSIGLLCTTMIKRSRVIGYMDAYELVPILASVPSTYYRAHPRFLDEVNRITAEKLKSVVESCGDIAFAKSMWKTYRHAALEQALDTLLQKELDKRYLSSKARVIQSKWRHAISDPSHPICRRRLLNEFCEDMLPFDTLR